MSEFAGIKFAPDGLPGVFVFMDESVRAELLLAYLDGGENTLDAAARKVVEGRRATVCIEQEDAPDAR